MSDPLEVNLDALVFKTSKEQVKDLTAFFKPKSIAVVGASPNPEKIGNQILRNLVDSGYKGKIYPIHPVANQVLNNAAYPSLADVPGDVDLTIISIPAPLVKEAVEQCVAKKVKCTAVITSGFAEVGKHKEEDEIRDIANAHDMAMLGPNIFGVVYAPNDMNASFGPYVTQKGKIAFLTQSGALGIALMGWTEMEGIGFASVVSVGNKADIGERELIEYFNNDPEVEVILIYMEGLKDGRDFMTTKIKKPVVVLKVGTSQRGAKAAASHTGSLAGSDKIYDAAFKQLGVLRASSFTEAFGWSRCLSLPEPQGEEILIITNGGGIGVRTTDECEGRGLKLFEDPEYLEKKYRPTMPDFGSTKNPIDITGGAGEKGYTESVAMALEDPRVDALIVLYCETTVTDPMNIAKAVVDPYLQVGRNKPVLVAMVGGEKTRKAIHYLNENGIPAFTSISEAVSGLSVLYEWKRISNENHQKVKIDPPPQKVLDICQRVKDEGRSILMEHEAREVLQLVGVPTPKSGFAANEEQAVKLAEGMYPLAMKIASPDIVHKTDVQGVVLNINNEEELRLKFRNMMTHIGKVKPEARLEGVNLIQMVKGIECIVGLSCDPQFGPAVMFGLGGVFVEVLKDVSFRIVPFNKAEATRLIDDIKGKKILEGFRGTKAHKESIIQTLFAVQRLAPIAKELDINPLITNDSGSFAVDARIVI